MRQVQSKSIISIAKFAKLNPSRTPVPRVETPKSIHHHKSQSSELKKVMKKFNRFHPNVKKRNRVISRFNSTSDFRKVDRVETSTPTPTQQIGGKIPLSKKVNSCVISVSVPTCSINLQGAREVGLSTQDSQSDYDSTRQTPISAPITIRQELIVNHNELLGRQLEVSQWLLDSILSEGDGDSTNSTLVSHRVSIPFLPSKAHNAKEYTLVLDLDETLIHYPECTEDAIETD